MAELARVGMILLTGLLEAFTNWMEQKERKTREEHVADVRADPAAHWLRRFGGTRDKRTTAPGSTNAGGRGHE